VVQVLEFDRLGRREVDEIRAGDMCAVVGIDDAEIGDTICEFDKPKALPPLTIDEPTLDMLFRVNDSPFAGQEGKPLTSRELRDRLERELQHNVALRVRPGERESEFIVSGRGLLHLGVLLETMRREGSELSVGKPRVILKEIDGEKQEPFEDLVVECPGEHVGAVMRLVLERQGECYKMEAVGGTTHMRVPHPGPRPHRPADADADRHQRHGDHAPQLPGVPPGQGGDRRPAAGVMVSTETGKATGLRHRGVAGPRQRVRRPDGAGVRGAGRRRALPGQRPAGEHRRGRRS
jgi:GTP-binding protein